MTTRFALRAFLCLAFALMSIEVWGSVELQSFGVSPSVPNTLFSTIGPQGAPGAEASPGATVAWPVTMNLALLNTLPATIQVNFPDRASVALTRMRSERRGSGLLWSGRGGDCSGLFRVFPDGDFKGTLSCLDAPYGVNHLAGSSNLRLTRYGNAGTQSWYEPPPTGPADVTKCSLAPPPPAGADTTVDILVLFNGTMTTTDIWRRATDIVDEIQHAMENSTFGFPATPAMVNVRLAGAARISRSVINDPVGDLDALRNDPETLALRDYWAGDVVLYITRGDSGSGNTWGISNIPGYNLPCPGPNFAPYAIAVTLTQYATAEGEHIAAHEVAHTFGTNHNYDNVPRNLTPIRPYAWGHWAANPDQPNVGARTIMAYVNQCTATDCPAVLHFSNPDIIVDGWFHTGAPLRDNARVIEEVAPTQAQYRDSKGRIFKHGFE